MTLTETIPAQRNIIAGAIRGTHLDPEGPAFFTDNALAVLLRRYLAIQEDGTQETPERMCRRVAENIASRQGDAHGWDDYTRQQTADRYFELMASLRFLPNSPTLTNAGRPLQQLSACYVLPVPDDLGGIFDAVKQAALIHKSGGGTGFDFSSIRPAGDAVASTQGVASGPVSFMDAFDTATEAVKQGGTRRGANMGILRVDHPDIREFINRKREGEHLQNFNVSVGMTDAFMAALTNGATTYDLIHPVTGEVTGQESVAEVWNSIILSAWETGDPGMVFLDAINRHDPSAHLGAMTATNPCGEQPLRAYESCNLGSINLARMLHYNGEHYAVDWDLLESTVAAAVQFLDGVIDANDYPLPQITAAAHHTRRIGLGVMGLADMLSIMGVGYATEEGINTAQDVMRRIQLYTHVASANLAQQWGAYPAQILGNDVIPMRHTAPVTIAPTGTISRIAGVSSGIEPHFALSFTSNIMDGTQLRQVNPYFEAIAEAAGVYTPELQAYVAEYGVITQDVAPEWLCDLFPCAAQIAPLDHVAMQAAVQEYTDNAVSKTINMPAEATPEDVAAVYLTAWESQCKGITVYRDGSKDGQVLTAGNSAGVKTLAARRPQQLQGDTTRVETYHGSLYVTVNKDASGDPFEVLASLSKPGSCEAANAEAVCRLVSLALRAGIDVQEVIDQLQGIACHPAYDDGALNLSVPDSIARVLSKHQDKPTVNGNGSHGHHPDLTLVRPDCPECHRGVMQHAEGCSTCPLCAYSSCG